MSERTTGRPATPGIVEPAALYTIAELGRRAGLKAWGLRQARKSGLRVLGFGAARYVRGRDFIEWLETHADIQSAVQSPNGVDAQGVATRE